MSWRAWTASALVAAVGIGFYIRAEAASTASAPAVDAALPALVTPAGPYKTVSLDITGMT